MNRNIESVEITARHQPNPLPHGVRRRVDRPAFHFAPQSDAAGLDGGGGLEPDIPFHGSLRDGRRAPAKSAMRSGADTLPERDPAALMRELYAAENRGRSEPSGSQDMAGLIYPGVNRLDYRFDYEGGIFPAHVESNNDPALARWLENVMHIVPVASGRTVTTLWESRIWTRHGLRGWDRPARIALTPSWPRVQTELGASMNECMNCWEAILPQTVRHPTIQIDLPALLEWYQTRFAGAMFSGCGGGYLYVVSEEPVRRFRCKCASG